MREKIVAVSSCKKDWLHIIQNETSYHTKKKWLLVIQNSSGCLSYKKGMAAWHKTGDWLHIIYKWKVVWHV